MEWIRNEVNKTEIIRIPRNEMKCNGMNENIDKWNRMNQNREE